MKRTDLFYLFWQSCLLVFSGLGLQILNYEVAMNFKIPPEWLQNIRNKCTKDELNGPSFQFMSLSEWAAIFATAGSLWGLLAQSWLTPGIINGKIPDGEPMCCKTIRRMLMMLLLQAPWSIYLTIMTKNPVDSAYGMLALLSPGAFMIPFNMFFVNDYVCEKIGWLKIEPFDTETETVTDSSKVDGEDSQKKFGLQVS